MRTILAVLAVLTMPPGVLAQSAAAEPPRSALGSRVRVTARPVAADAAGTAAAKPMIGTLTAFDEHTLTLTLADRDTTIVLPAERVLRLETLRKPSRRKKGALIGASVLGGVALSLFVSLCTTDWGCQGADPERVVAFVGVSAGLGALLGAAAAAGDRWKEVPFARATMTNGARPRLNLGLTPGGGVAASVSLRLPARSRP